MKFSLPRSELLPALSVVAGVVERRHTLPILGNVLVNAEDECVRLQGTDLEIEIRTMVTAEVSEPGAVTVPARKLLEIVRSLPDGASVECGAQGGRVRILCGRSRFSLGSLDAGGFPSMEVPQPELEVRVATEVIRRLLDKTSFAMAHQDVRYFLNGVLLEVSNTRVVAVATDGHRLAKAVGSVEALDTAETGDSLRQVILPAKAVLELKRLLGNASGDVCIRLSERTFEAAVGETVLVSKLVEGQYPEYERVIPAGLSYRALVEREALRGALQRTAILSNEKYRGVRMSFSSGRLGLLAENPENEAAEDEVEIEFDGPKVGIGFNVGYVLDVLAAVDVQTLEVEFENGDKSAIWRGQDAEDELFVIMPMRL